MSLYVELPRERWSRLQADRPPLSEEELRVVRGLNSPISMKEAEEVYMPLARLLLLQIRAARDRAAATAGFLGEASVPVHPPFVIGVAGSVAVGKSTTSRLLQVLLARMDGVSHVDLVTTDGFLFPNRVLEERGLMRRKGFPESYDVKALVEFVTRVRTGESAVPCPVYSHRSYDVVEGQHQVVDRPDVLILEGLNVLQTGTSQRRSRRLLSDLLDFSIYVDASVADLAAWYERRFFLLRDTAFRDPASHFHRYASLTDDEARETARSIWKEINEANLLRNILPTRDRAHLVLEKDADHSVQRIRLRRA